MPKVKTDAAVLRKAAKIIEDDLCWDKGMGACTAIAQALANGDPSNYWGKYERHSLPVRYSDTFKPQHDHFYSTYWARNWIDVGVLAYEEQRQQMRDCRILALCFAAAMAETGDLT
jgi:hypothetical protein